MSTINAAETVVRFALGRDVNYYDGHLLDGCAPWPWAERTIRAVAYWRSSRLRGAWKAQERGKRTSTACAEAEEQPWL
jgi:hypothetical protein